MIVGIGLLTAAGVQAVGVRSFVRGATVADGVVARLNAGGSHPEIEFDTASGQKISYPQGGFIFGYRPGDKVRVLYDRDAPAQTARVDAFGALWFVPLLLALLGVASLASARYAGRLPAPS